MHSNRRVKFPKRYFRRSSRRRWFAFKNRRRTAKTSLDVFFKLHVHYDGIIELPDGRMMLYYTHHTYTCTSRASILKGSLVSRSNTPVYMVVATKKGVRPRWPPPISQSAISPLLIFARSRRAEGISDAMGVKRPVIASRPRWVCINNGVSLRFVMRPIIGAR